MDVKSISTVHFEKLVWGENIGCITYVFVLCLLPKLYKNIDIYSFCLLDVDIEWKGKFKNKGKSKGSIKNLKLITLKEIVGIGLSK